MNALTGHTAHPTHSLGHNDTAMEGRLHVLILRAYEGMTGGWRIRELGAGSIHGLSSERVVGEGW